MSDAALVVFPISGNDILSKLFLFATCICDNALSLLVDDTVFMRAVNIPH